MGFSYYQGLDGTAAHDDSSSHLPLGKFVSATGWVDCSAIPAIDVLSGIKQPSLVFRWRALDICSIYSTLASKHSNYNYRPQEKL